MKFIENKSEKIVKGIFLGAIIYFSSYLLIFLTQYSSSTSLAGHYITVGGIVIGTLLKPISVIIILKFLCDVLYKILKAIDKYNSPNEE
jgi:uncharacterized membrane protein